MMKPIRVLVVDDSPTMRAIITNVISSDPAIEVVGHASDPLEAREAIKKTKPDVVTLDIEMPNMNGLEFLQRVMKLHPLPVIMVSSLTQHGASATIRALELGAVDCIGKPTSGSPASLSELPRKIRSAAKSRPRTRKPPQGDHASGASTYEPDGKIVAIGASTGGVEALIEILGRYPANCPPTLVTLHMPAMFTRTFAKRLDDLCAAHVEEAANGAPLAAGHVYLAPGCDTHLALSPRQPYRCLLRTGDRVNGHRPSIDVLFDSVSKAARGNAVGVILTGMGRDGAQGLLQMRLAGARTLAQDEASSVIFGMPRVAMEIGAAERCVPIERIAGEILSATCAPTKRIA